ncbi:MAG: DUF1416 domain-containing protein [Chloroherpetonaceae bacterium]|nr:carboxypeptidase-like regulatory domain-containing protein [Chthonomonadaceae bacterium]MDW8208099.1 DUF1416 domain-containing protein [Chloroherpetonaceae bacterium]
MRPFFLLRSAGSGAILATVVLLTGCGGGGGGAAPAGVATIIGRVLRAETNTRPDPVATITAGSASTTSSPTDGSFTLTGVPVNQTALTVTAQGARERTVLFTLTAGQTLDLGAIYLSDSGYDAAVSGRVVTIADNQQQGVAGASVTIAGLTTTTQQNGAFTINGLPVGLGSVPGVYGRVSAQGFESKDITAETLEFPLTAGNNVLRNPIVILPPSGNVPLPPYTITGTVTFAGQPTAGAVVRLTNLTTNLTTTTDASGQYFFWVVAGTYTVSATLQNVTGQVQVTLSRVDTPVTAPTINLAP